VRAVNRNRCFGPFRGLIATRGIGEHPTSSAGIFAGDNNAGFISPLGRARRGIDGDNHSYQRRGCADAQSFQHAAVPQGTWNIFEELSFELLAAETSPLIFPNYLSEERRGEIGAVLVSGPPRNDDRRIGDLRRLRIFGQQDKLRADRSKGRETWA
jgi:hypothetical protein